MRLLVEPYKTKWLPSTLDFAGSAKPPSLAKDPTRFIAHRPAGQTQAASGLFSAGCRWMGIDPSITGRPPVRSARTGSQGLSMASSNPQLQPTTMRHNNLNNSWTALSALEGGLPLSRKMTDPERVFVAVALHAAPKLHVTLTSAALDLAGVRAAWPNLRKRLERYRIERGRKDEAPLIYIGAAAKATGTRGGYHLHLLVWQDYFPRKVLKPRAVEVGFDGCDIKRISPLSSRGLDASGPKHAIEGYTQIAYALSQHQPIFGSRQHLKNEPLVPGQQWILKPSRATLERVKPELLSALDMAKSRSIRDEELVRDCSYFINR